MRYIALVLAVVVGSIGNAYASTASYTFSSDASFTLLSGVGPFAISGTFEFDPSSGMPVSLPGAVGTSYIYTVLSANIILSGPLGPMGSYGTAAYTVPATYVVFSNGTNALTVTFSTGISNVGSDFLIGFPIPLGNTADPIFDVGVLLSLLMLMKA
jgi:hypothetical protein